VDLCRGSTVKLSISYLSTKNNVARYAFLGFFKVATVDCHALPESLHPIERDLIQDWFMNNLNVQQKLIGHLK
jgi:hypothetical protein